METNGPQQKLANVTHHVETNITSYDESDGGGYMDGKTYQPEVQLPEQIYQRDHPQPQYQPTANPQHQQYYQTQNQGNTTPSCSLN